MNLSPVQRFQKSDFAKMHAELTAAPWFHAAVTTALVKMQLEIQVPADPTQAACSAWKLAGARDFVTILLNLAEPAPQGKVEPRQNLKPL